LTAYMVKSKPPEGKAPARPAKAPATPGAKPSLTPVTAPGEPATAESKISRVDAQRHVVVTNATDTGRGDYGVYNADTGICTLVDNVVIARGKDVIKGQYGVMDLNKNVSRMLPTASGAPAGSPQRVQGLFIREDQAHGAGTEGGTPSGKGSSAVGKTPCFYIITGLIAADTGTVELDGQDITELPMYRRARLGIGYLPQEASIFRGLTVEQNIRAILEVAEPEPDAREAMLDGLLAEFSISHLRRAPAMALSGGERRRCEIARALAMQPNFILL